jgi:hypothetical protein
LPLACGAEAIAENDERDTALRIAESGIPTISWAFHCPWCAHLVSPDFTGSELTILHIAAREGHSAAIKLFLENNVNPMSQDGAEEAFLHWAIFSMNEAVVKVPLDNDLEPNVMSIWGHTNLQVSQSRKGLTK